MAVTTAPFVLAMVAMVPILADKSVDACKIPTTRACPMALLFYSR
jgi:hypothetical protein